MTKLRYHKSLSQVERSDAQLDNAIAMSLHLVKRPNTMYRAQTELLCYSSRHGSAKVLEGAVTVSNSIKIMAPHECMSFSQL